MEGDLFAVVVTLAYVAGWIVIGEVMHRLGANILLSRKIVHIGASGVIFVFAFVYETPEPAMATIVLIAALAMADRSRHVFKGIQSRDAENLGTVWFWVAMLLVVAVLWEEPRLMVTAVVPMAVGDPLAGLVGATWGKRMYAVGTHIRTAEGTSTFAVSTFVLTFVALIAIDATPDVAAVTAVAVAVVLACVGAAIEAVSRWGVDNLTITIASVIALLVLV
jgi:phytol kinase